MNTNFLLNGKTYNLPNIDFEFIYKLEDYGVSLPNLQEVANNKFLHFCTTIFAVSQNITIEETKKIFSEAISQQGGSKTINELLVLFEAVKNSDFFKERA